MSVGNKRVLSLPIGNAGFPLLAGLRLNAGALFEDFAQEVAGIGTDFVSDCVLHLIHLRAVDIDHHFVSFPREILGGKIR